MIVGAESFGLEALAAFGPYAFGVAAFLVLWKVVVVPLMDQNRVDAQTATERDNAHRRFIEEQTKAATFQAESLRGFIERSNQTAERQAALQAAEAAALRSFCEGQTKAMAGIVEHMDSLTERMVRLRET